MDLLYYYPLRGGAPANVGRNIFIHLLKRRKELPFDKIILFVPIRDLKEVQKQFSDLKVITFINLNSISKNSLVHVPVSPLIYPNSKFLLHLFATFTRMKFMLNYHGDMRKELQLKFRYEHSFNILYIPSYITMPYLLRSADKLIVHSYLMSNLVESKYAVKSDVVIPNAIEESWFDESDNRPIELDGEPTFFYHGRLSPEKGVDLLLKGFSNAVGKSSKAVLYIAADGSQRKYLEKLCRNFGIENKIVFLGFIDKKGIKSYLKSVDMAIYPSTWDNFPLAILEALSSAKCPVYFSKQAGIYDFVVRDGFRLNAFEPTVEKISKIIKDVIDGKRNEQVVKQQKEFARRYMWDNVIDQYIELYNQLER